MAAVIQEQIQTNQPGVTVNITVEPKKQRVEDIQEGNYEVCLTRWGPDYADPHDLLNMWITDNNNNYGKWSTLSTTRSLPTAPPASMWATPRPLGCPVRCGKDHHGRSGDRSRVHQG